MRVRALCCDVLRREAYFAAAASPHAVDLEFLPKGLHDIGAAGMRERVQEAIDRTDSCYDALVLGYGLCNNGLVGIHAPHCKLVLPRAHDCITLFLGSRQRYLDYFNSRPGCYFLTSGWIERGSATGAISQLTIQHKNGMDLTLRQMIEKYGEDNGPFLYETLCAPAHNYSRVTFIPMGVEPVEQVRRDAEQYAHERKWRFETEPGDIGMIRRMIDGDWSDTEFLIVPPGVRIEASNDEDIVRLEQRPSEVAATDTAQRHT